LFALDTYRSALSATETRTPCKDNNYFGFNNHLINLFGKNNYNNLTIHECFFKSKVVLFHTHTQLRANEKNLKECCMSILKKHKNSPLCTLKKLNISYMYISDSLISIIFFIQLRLRASLCYRVVLAISSYNRQT